MGTVSVSTSLGEKFNITFTNGNKYDLDSIFDAKSRMSQKALVVEVKRNQAVAQRALKQLESDLTKNIASSLNRDEVIASVNDIITSVFKVYGRESGSAPFAIQLIDSKITNYLQTVLNRTDIYFDITIYDNKADIQYSLPDDFIRGKFTEYYNKFTNNYSSAMSVSTGGLAISDKTETFNMSSSDYGKYLYSEPSNNYYDGSHNNCASNDVHWHQCGCDQTKPGDLGSLDFITNPENIALINELKKVFLSKKSASEKIETKYVRADKGYFKKVYVDDDLVMKNINVTGNVAGSTISGENIVVSDTLRVDSGRIELSAPDGHFYEVFLDKETGKMVLHSRVAGTDSFNILAAVDRNSESGHVYYNNETASFEVRDLDLTNYYTKEEIDEKIKDISANVDIKIGLEFADSIESITEPKIGTIYLIPDKDDVEEGKYVEYIYANGEFESIGTTKINLEGYATKEDLQAAIDAIEHPTVDLSGYYTKTETDTLVAEKIAEAQLADKEIDLSTYATKEDLNGLANIVDTLGGQIPTKTSALENDSGFITVEEVDNKISEAQHPSELYIVDYNNPSFTEAVEAYNSGKLLLLANAAPDGNSYAMMNYVSNKYITFTKFLMSRSTQAYGAFNTYYLTPDNKWEVAKEVILNKVEAITTDNIITGLNIGKETYSLEHLATTEVVNNITQQVEQVENKITDVEENVVEVVKEQIKEVVSGDTSQVESIKYVDFDELEG